MRKKWKFITALFVIAVIATAYCGAFWYNYRPCGADVGVVKQEADGESIIIVLKATNMGGVPLVYHGSPPFRAVRVDAGRGWTDLPQTYSSQMSSLGWIFPGESLSYSVSVPPGTIQAQVTCFFTTGGARTRVFAWLTNASWGDRLFRCLRGLLPDGPAKDVEYLSPVVRLTINQ